MVPDFVSSLLFFIYLIVKVPMLMHCELFAQAMDNIKLGPGYCISIISGSMMRYAA